MALPQAASGRIGLAWRVVMLMVLATVVVMSAIAVVYTKHQSRVLFKDLQNLRQDKDRMDVEWGQLLLEQSTWATHGRVERIARTRLGMRLPERDRILVIRQVEAQ